MKFWSDDIKPNEVMSMDHVLSADYGFGCEGGNISPSLSWSDLPADATHVTVLCFDPDAPTGHGVPPSPGGARHREARTPLWTVTELR